MNTKPLTIPRQPMLPNRNNHIFFLILIIFLSFQYSIIGAQSGEDDTIVHSKGSRHVSKSSKILHTNDDNEALKESKVSEEKSIYAQEEDVELVRGKISQSKKEPPDSYFWKIFFRTKSAGKVSIDLMDELTLGRHASIQIFLNKTAQGKHIGRIAYERACRLSHYDVVYASMRRNNIASYRSAQAAGFREVKNKAFKQCVMKWTRFK